jgi:GT2 family glycosyltransferase
LVDVMLPAFGDDTLVRQAIVSVREQTDGHWRLSVVDDGPAAGRDPNLGDWVRRLDDHRISYLANLTRLGINRNFQRCVDLSTHELVVILGADDRLLPDFVARVRAVAAERPQLAFIHTGARVVDAAGRPSAPMADRVKALTSIKATSIKVASGVREIGGEQLAASLLRGNWMYFPSVAFRREWLVRHGFRPGYDVVQDLDLYLRILRGGGRVGLLGTPGIEYRRHPASVSSEGAEDGSRFDEERRFFAEAAAELTEAGWPRAASAARWHLTSRLHALQRATLLLAAGQRAPAGRMLRGALGTVLSGAPPYDVPGGGSVRAPFTDVLSSETTTGPAVPAVPASEGAPRI